MFALGVITTALFDVLMLSLVAGCAVLPMKVGLKAGMPIIRFCAKLTDGAMKAVAVIVAMISDFIFLVLYVRGRSAVECVRCVICRC